MDVSHYFCSIFCIICITFIHGGNVIIIILYEKNDILILKNKLIVND